MKLLIPALTSAIALLSAKIALPQTMIHQDGQPSSCMVRVDEEPSVCRGFRMVESENVYLFIFDGVPDRGNVGFVAVKEPFRTEQGETGIVTNVYAVGHVVEGDVVSDIVGYCVWAAPLNPPFFNGLATCRDSLDEGAAEYEYRG